MHKTYLLGALLLIAGLVPTLVFADTPSITSLTTNPAGISNDYSIAFNWTTTGLMGTDLYVTCPVGVTLKNNGNSFPCNTRQPVGTAGVSPDFVALNVTNISGTTQTVTATLYPKDSTGADYDAGARSVSFTVTTAPQPLTGFTVASPTIASGANETFTWTGVDITASNIQFDCAPGVQLYSQDSTTTPLTCGNGPSFKTDLAGSGSVSVTAINSNTSPTPVTAHMLPSIAVGSYDGTHALVAMFTVGAMAGNPAVTSVTSTSSAITIGTPFTVSWQSSNAAGVNFQFDCIYGVQFFSLAGTTTTPLNCDQNAFATALATSGVATFLASSTSATVSGPIVVRVIPQNAAQLPYATNQQALNLPVGAKRSTGSTQVAPTAVGTPSTQTASSTGTVGHYFTTPLDVGSHGAQVTLLQQFLAQNSDIYPAGLVTGYFGSLTLRAVEAFQTKYNLSTPTDPAYGFVGPKTRAKLNSLTTP